VKKLGELIEKHRVTLMIATPTFLRGYLRGVNREQLASIKLCVTGAEKLPPPSRMLFETKFGKRVLEGYGLTETSPVSNVNLPGPRTHRRCRKRLRLAAQPPAGQRRPDAPGLAIRITHPETGEPQSHASAAA
jgi:acyl-[acyl-carrier-protein]-phospholipid O-acyltransferase/long-chain-fatty-acid--[acyl-carrier-protein] ligase